MDGRGFLVPVNHDTINKVYHPAPKSEGGR